MRFALRRFQRATADAQAIVEAEPVGHQHPRTEPRHAGFDVGQVGVLRIEPEFVALRVLRVAADQFVGARRLGARGFLPDHQLQRIAAAICTHAVVFACQAGARCGRARIAGQRFAHRQRRRADLRRRIDQQLRGRLPHRPDAKGAERKARLGRQRRHRMQPTPFGQERDRDRFAALGRHVAPGPLAAAAHGQADAVAHAAPRVVQHDAEHGGAARVLRFRRHQMQRQPAQCPMSDVHADGDAAGQQEGQQIAEIELVIDRRDQQHQQREAEHPACARRHDVDVALREFDDV